MMGDNDAIPEAGVLRLVREFPDPVLLVSKTGGLRVREMNPTAMSTLAFPKS
jgi:hypothetical protein